MGKGRKITQIEYVLCAGHFYRYLLVQSTQNLFKTGSEKLSSLPKTTQQLNGFATGSI